MDNLKLQESGENYLEAILVLEKRNGIARSIDVANELGFSKPSVSRAVSILKDAGFVEIGSINQLLLTESGRSIAEKIYDRHCTLREYLVSIGVSEEIAADDACRIEHVISDETFNCIKKMFDVKNLMEYEKRNKKKIRHHKKNVRTAKLYHELPK